jgi:riboflavin kinase/FMN adenylyltransferase
MEQQYVATIGMFDGVHRGHRALIESVNDYAVRHALQPMVVTFHPHPVAVIRPGSEPKLLTGYAERGVMLRACVGTAGCVVELEFDEDLRRLTAEQFMRMLRNKYGVKVLVMGYNHSFGSDRIKDFNTYKAIGTELGMEIMHGEQMCDKDIDLQVSSSSIRNLLLDGDVSTANKLLGRLYELRGKVVTGKQVGRTIGFPTANLSVRPERMVPADGVYAALTCVEGREYAAMVNIGTCPTVSEGCKRSIEANIIDWSGDIYDREISIKFVQRLRSERKFDSLEALMHQLDEDKAATIAQINII